MLYYIPHTGMVFLLCEFAYEALALKTLRMICHIDHTGIDFPWSLYHIPKTDKVFLLCKFCYVIPDVQTALSHSCNWKGVSPV